MVFNANIGISLRFLAIFNQSCFISLTSFLPNVPNMRGSKGGAGGPDLPRPWKTTKLKGINTDPDPLENHRATKPASNVGT